MIDRMFKAIGELQHRIDRGLFPTDKYQRHEVLDDIALTFTDEPEGDDVNWETYHQLMAELHRYMEANPATAKPEPVTLAEYTTAIIDEDGCITLPEGVVPEGTEGFRIYVDETRAVIVLEPCAFVPLRGYQQEQA